MHNVVYYPAGTREIRHRRTVIELTAVNETLILIEESPLGETAIVSQILTSCTRIFHLIKYKLLYLIKYKYKYKLFS